LIEEVDESFQRHILVGAIPLSNVLCQAVETASCLILQFPLKRLCFRPFFAFHAPASDPSEVQPLPNSRSSTIGIVFADFFNDTGWSSTGCVREIQDAKDEVSWSGGRLCTSQDMACVDWFPHSSEV
jgi:hypothetical protein